jgi:hypothetical protein
VNWAKSLSVEHSSAPVDTNSRREIVIDLPPFPLLAALIVS